MGYRVESCSQPKAIKELLQEAYSKHKNKEPITFITDGGCENVNSTVQQFLVSTNEDIKHLIAQKDIPFSNSKIEAFNKIIKHQFLLPRNSGNRIQLIDALHKDVLIYNTLRPQLTVEGNTPAETFAGKALDMSTYKTHFSEQKSLRVLENQQNSCKSCKSIIYKTK